MPAVPANVTWRIAPGDASTGGVGAPGGDGGPIAGLVGQGGLQVVVGREALEAGRLGVGRDRLGRRERAAAARRDAAAAPRVRGPRPERRRRGGLGAAELGAERRHVRDLDAARRGGRGARPVAVAAVRRRSRPAPPAPRPDRDRLAPRRPTAIPGRDLAGERLGSPRERPRPSP